ncbi:MAG: 5-oxoprolinase subunit PxpB [Alphaproteobacteria bacterium]|nr:5-oxoprolinase subunit PxpB [Alphaproteobacteria bacterium]
MGDVALIVEFGTAIDRAISRRVMNLARAVRRGDWQGVVDVVPTFRSLMVCYDPLRTSRAELEDRIGSLFDHQMDMQVRSKLWRIPIIYGGEFGPDLDNVADRTGLSSDDVVERHSSIQYHVYMIGFLPGYPYLGDLTKELQLPRLEKPRLRVPRRSVAIAQQITGVYPVESPGGWHLIGRVPVPLFDLEWPRPSLLLPGDAVRFEPVSQERFRELESAATEASYEVPSEEIGAG